MLQQRLTTGGAQTNEIAIAPYLGIPNANPFDPAEASSLAGLTVAQVLAQVDWQSCSPDTAKLGWQTSIWGRAAPADNVLKERDRIEITRALRVDPKVARRERFQRQGVRTAGLFARRGRP